eukprot:GHVU01175459.1.p1 GENE.GHVU01175459.1~~GHVU01175459.1.p1  ORF type:complete len:230 (+),score=27.21 GHVU01175459.1:771-1460(+)
MTRVSARDKEGCCPFQCRPPRSAYTAALYDRPAFSIASRSKFADAETEVSTRRISSPRFSSSTAVPPSLQSYKVPGMFESPPWTPPPRLRLLRPMGSGAFSVVWEVEAAASSCSGSGDQLRLLGGTSSGATTSRASSSRDGGGGGATTRGDNSQQRAASTARVGASSTSRGALPSSLLSSPRGGQCPHGGFPPRYDSDGPTWALKQIRKKDVFAVPERVRAWVRGCVGA